MSMTFPEAFPTFDAPEAFQAIIPHLEVERLSITPKRDLLRVYMTVDRLIEKQEICLLEEEITKQLFRSKGLNVLVRIYEHFILSEQYNLTNLLDVYQESILFEFWDRSRVDYTLINSAEFCPVDEHTLQIRMPDSLMAQDRANEICRVIDKILNERFDMGASVEIVFTEAKEREKDFGKYIPDTPTVYTYVPEESVPGPLPVPETKTEHKTKKAYLGRKNGKSLKSSKKEVKEENNPDLIFGRFFDDEIQPISSIDDMSSAMAIRGKIMKLSQKETKSGRVIVSFDLADESDAISVKLFVEKDQTEALVKALDPRRNDKKHEMNDVFVRVKGIPRMDTFDKEITFGSVTGIMKAGDFRVSRMDNAAVKRVELHCHTKMSDMDGVSDVKDLVKCAIKWGMPGIAITDHGVVQAFPDAALAAAKHDDFKILYGMEGYLVDDRITIVDNDKGQTLRDTVFVVFDIETTGFSILKNKIIQIGAIKIRNGIIEDRFSELVNPQVPVPLKIEKLTGINDTMLLSADTIDKVLPKFMDFCGDSVLVGHNVTFDSSFIQKNCKDLGLPYDHTTVDTLGLARVFFPQIRDHSLKYVAQHLKVKLEQAHRADHDAECTAEIFMYFYERLLREHKETLGDLCSFNRLPQEAIRRRRHTDHIILLAKNTLGRSNLYRLVSRSHMDYMGNRPHLPKSLIEEYREGLIIGSACVAGELYKALLEDRPDDEIERIVSFYDYLEIQPLGNNAFLVASDDYGSIQSIEDVQKINKRIVELGKQFNKPVVATCDSHFLNPEDQILRTIIMAGRGFDDEEPAPLYLRTTDEMLKEFDYLDRKTAYEIVVENTRRIFDMCDKIPPIRPDKCSPVIEGSDQMLDKICRTRAEQIYGSPLPPIVKERMERELNDIINNGYAVMYIIAQKLVWKSVEDGYLVGSRGSVGSSFAAFLAEITEVNSLRPHYVCPNCKYSDFDSPEVLAYKGRSGCDMPDKVCPKCGTVMNKDGFDIPFETFMGFTGDKEPDIDLNFSGEYQSKAHEYTKVIFGADQTFRAGTIQTIADKTAYGYVKKYYEECGEERRRSEIERVVWDMLGVRRGTGQHPGGIVVLPVGEEIETITPIQHPPKQKKGENDDDAPDESEKTITTHFDYHKIEANLLKLDILGHDDPTMIRFFQDNTDVDPVHIPLDDRKVMSLFQDTSALGITPDDIHGTKLGCLGIPEFGTDFAMQMVIEAKPSSMTHLIRISGLSHGENVWAGNAQTLISEGTATIDTAICTRDDIMDYLIGKGMDKALSFKTMESVRKGKGLTPEMEEAMVTAEVPDWYIASCKKIQYMFPKAHAAAYVMMAWRIAWFKVYRPAAFYAAWFSIRAKAFSYQDMCQGVHHMKNRMAEINAKEKDKTQKLEDKEKNLYYAMRVAEEMYSRGITFVPIKLEKVRSRQFQVISDTQIMPALTSLDNMGAVAADSLVNALAGGPFLSKEDVKSRTKVPAKVIDAMTELHILSDLPESNQLSLFDLMG